MAWSPISNTVPQYSKNAGGAAAADYYLKFYADGTTTPINMATDSTGGTTLAKCQLDSLGYPTTDGSTVFVPHIDQDYKLALYTNSTDADNNTLASAAWVVDNLEPVATITTGTIKNFATLAAAVADTGLIDGDAISIAERTTGYGGGGLWDVVLSSTVTENTYNIVQCTGVATLSLVLREEPYVIKAAQYGVIADGTLSAGTDNSTVLQWIFDNMDSRSELILPSGRIRILSQLNLGVSRTLRIKLKGQGSPKTELIAGAAMTAMIQIPNAIANTNQLANSFFEQFIMNANNNADYCIKGYGNFNTFRDITFTNAEVAGCDYSYGWDTCWYNCYWLSNTVGFTNDQQQSNQNTFVGCKFGAGSTGLCDYGVLIGGSYGIGFYNCAFEFCDKAAGIFWGVEGLSIDGSCYFDNNSETGHAFTTPSTTVNSDIILNGSTNDALMDSAFPCRGININAPFVSQAGAGAHSFIYAVATESLGIYNPVLLTGESSDLITTYGSSTTSSQYSRNENMHIVKPQGFDNNYVIENSTTGYAGEPNMNIDGIQSFNIMPDMSTWTALVGGVSSTFTQSSSLHPLGPLVDVYEIDAGSDTGTTQSWGVTITVADYARLIAQPMVLQIDVNNQNSGATTTVACDGWSDTHTSTNWRTFYVIFNMPASGTFNITVKRSGAAGKTFVAIPRLAELGSDFNQMIS